MNGFGAEMPSIATRSETPKTATQVNTLDGKEHIFYKQRDIRFLFLQSHYVVFNTKKVNKKGLARRE